MVYSIIPREGEVLATGREHERYGTGHPSFVPYQAFEAEDRKWFFLSCFTPKFWSNLCQAIGRPDLEKDPRFASNTDRVKNRQKLILLLEKIFRQKPMAEWIARIQEADVPCGPVNDLEMVMKDPQVVHNRMVASIDHPKMGMIRTMSHPIRFLGTPARLELPPPALGEHTTCILQEIGFTTAEIKDFKEKRVI
jgi:crotonobetainyl-CoA:carnitine CoA-transferase CaiB-like acyl-CoA transferase